jgi:ribosomal protein L37E
MSETEGILDERSERATVRMDGGVDVRGEPAFADEARPLGREAVIYCPRCGRVAGSTQKFCTGCGLHLLAVRRALADHAAKEVEELERRTKAMRHGLRTMFSGIGLALFFYFFFGHSLGFAAIGLMIFVMGLGEVLSAMLFASPALRFKWRFPSAPREERKLSRSRVPQPGEQVAVEVRDQWASPPPAAEPTTLPLDPARRRGGEGRFA